jgi:acetate---CoA ligase (ADP-forming)
MRGFLEPESVAIIGASRQTGPGSFNILETIILYGYGGKLYPINPKADEICGRKVFDSVSSLPEVPDLAVISVGRENVSRAVQECGETGIKNVVIITQGFSDADERGAAMQNEIVQIAAAQKIRILGPNTMGVINNFRRFTTAFYNKKFPGKFVPVSVVAQTGLFQMSDEGFFSFEGWGKAIDIGNGCDIDHLDTLGYLAGDPETRVIVMHIEGLRRGKEFLSLASEITPFKPIIVFKTGRSSAGAKAALSHTGSLVGQEEVADAAFRKAGIIRVQNANELKDAVHALLYIREMKGPRLGILTITGAGGIMAADEAESRGLKLGDIPDTLAAKLTKEAPDWVKVGNPLDFWPAGTSKGNYAEVYSAALSGMMQAPEFDGVFTIIGSAFMKEIKDCRRHSKEKPLAIWIHDDATLPENFEKMENSAFFRTIENGIGGLAYCYEYYKNRTRKNPVQKSFCLDEDKLIQLLAEARSKKILSGIDALEFLSAFGISVSKSIQAANWRELEKAAREIGYPIVLKISGQEFIHKTDIGGVITSIKNKAELRRACDLLKNRMASAAAGKNFEFHVQKQAEGREILIGLKKDPQFRPVIVCGAGGIYAEILKDISRELTPVDAETIQRMLKSLRIYPLLKGIRGEIGIDFDGLTETIERISYLAQRVPDITELDLNPLMASPECCVAVDARIIFC